MNQRHALLAVASISVAAYVTALGNGFAYDDTGLILANPVVQGGDATVLLSTPYWPQAASGSGLFRPLTSLTFLVEWKLWGEWPLPYHLLNVLLHTGAALLVTAIGAFFLAPGGALAAGLLFGVHPVHVEAVANIAGRGELLAALLVLLAVYLHLRGEASDEDGGRVLALVAVPVLYALALAAKEIAVTLPVLCLLASWGRPASAPSVGLRHAVRRLAPLLMVLGAVFVTYALFRISALGAFTGDAPAAELRGLSDGQRVMTALSLWPEYLRLMLFPVRLSADYGPAVLLPAVTLDGGVMVGGAVVLALAGAVLRERRAPTPVSVGILWFGFAVLPVSHLLFPTGTLLAERTLYLPSVGFCLAVGAVWSRLYGLRPHRRAVLAFGALALLLLGARTTARNPSWASTFDVYRTLHSDHPESFLAQRARAAGLAEVGELQEAGEAYRLAVALSPRHYATLAEAGEFFGRRRDYRTSEELLERAIAETRRQPLAYRLLSAHLIRQGRALEGHRIAALGLAQAHDDVELWRNLSEAYVALGDFPAAVRARRQALRVDPANGVDRRRLRELLPELLERGPAAESGRGPS